MCAHIIFVCDMVGSVLYSIISFISFWALMFVCMYEYEFMVAAIYIY